MVWLLCYLCISGGACFLCRGVSFGGSHCHCSPLPVSSLKGTMQTASTPKKGHMKISSENVFAKASAPKQVQPPGEFYHQLLLHCWFQTECINHQCQRMCAERMGRKCDMQGLFNGNAARYWEVVRCNGSALWKSGSLWVWASL